MNPVALVAALNGDMANALAASTPGGIEAQEAQGQRDFCSSSTLPIDCPRTELEEMGIVFGDNVDDLFVNAELPQGWQKVATEHSMHSDLLDDQGRRRATIFYKAAFYARCADMYLVQRYDVFRVSYEDGQPIIFAVKDGDEIVHAGREIPADSDYKEIDSLREEMYKWLDSNKPDWRDPTAYWA